MTYIAPRTEKLARAMCEALDIEPDAKHQSLPWSNATEGHLNFYRYCAQKWIYEHSGGKLPEREGEG